MKRLPIRQSCWPPLLLWVLVLPRAWAADGPLPAAELLHPRGSYALAPNSAFVPSARAGAAHSPFVGTLTLSETMLETTPKLEKETVLGRDPRLFPGVALSFFTAGTDLVPFSQDVIRIGTGPSGRSFWDIIVQPGRVWSEPGDGAWSRAAFPFALVNSIEGETHNGLATFLYGHCRVSSLRLQIVQQTAPFYIAQHFTATASITAAFGPAPVADIESLRRTFRASLVDPVRIADWTTLAAKVGSAALEGFDGTMPPQDIVLSGLDYRGTFYLKECRSAAGTLPWCDRARFGVWSATKALANESALLRLAQKFGPGVFDLKIADFVPQARAYPAWSKVRFEDAINMATGLGNGSPRRDPNDISDGYLDPSYAAWYEARSADAKVAALLADGRAYSWGPGKVARYRDQDMFILGVAMNNFLRTKEGDSADLWSMLEHEVFQPIGIRYAPVNRTVEPHGVGLALMAYGYYPTIGDMVRIARLYQAGGAWNGAQILYAPRFEMLRAGTQPRGLPTGEKLSGGETTYRHAFWIAPYESARGCRLYYPRMIGWGGNIVALLPGKITGIRIAHSNGSPGNADVDTAGMASTADRLVDLCGL